MKYKLLLAAACSLLFTFHATAQPNIIGNWVGNLEAGTMKLRIVYRLFVKEGVMRCSMDSPDQGVRGVNVSDVSQTADSIWLGAGPMVYRGRIVNDSTIDGVLQQGRSFPLKLRRTDQVERKRPQTPKAPFPYASNQVVYSNKDKSVTLGATITAPKDSQKHPAVLLISGSGQQNRDGEIMEHKPFAVIADYLSRKGYVVLRVDDRGIGKSTGDLSRATSADFAKDAGISLDYLKNRPEVDPQKIGVLGHSEGGMIASILAAERQDIAFVISMAGPGVANLQLLTEQNDALLEKRGIASDARKAYLKLYGNMLRAGMQKDSALELNAAINKVVSDWRTATSVSIVEQTTGIRDDSTQKSFASAFAGQIRIPWFRYFIAYDPAPVIRKLSGKVLVINGAQDIQVSPKSNIAGWRNALGKSKVKSSKVVELPGLNHLFQKCTRCDVDEYGELEQTMAPEVLTLIGDWLDKEIK